MKKRPRVLIADGGFLPAQTYGGPVVSINNICSLLHDEIDFFIICTDHELKSRQRMENIEYGWNNRENYKVRYFTDEEVTLKNLREVVEEICPDTIYINSLFLGRWVIPLLKVVKETGINALLAPRGSLCKNAFRKKYKKIPYIAFLRTVGLLRNIHFQSTSDEETEAIKKYLGGTDENIHFLTNIPSVPEAELTHPKKEKGKARFVFVSRIALKKNLVGAIQFFERVRGKVSLDIYGPLEDKRYWSKCQKAISELPKNISVNYKGPINHDHVFEVLSQYDAFLFPTLSENYGHVISEALYSGCPAIISDQTPWRNLQEHHAGWVIPLNDKKGFERAIQEVVDFDEEKEELYRKGAYDFACKQLDWDAQKRKYVKALSDVAVEQES